MNDHIPTPVQTSRGPAYEGRLLDRPEEEVVDQGAPFDMRTLISRRGIIGLVGLGVGAVTLAACSTGGTSSGPSGGGSSGSDGSSGSSTASGDITEIPDETAGPYPGDGSNGPDILERSGIVRSDITTSLDGGATAEGVPLTFTLTVTDMANDDSPFVGAAVYAWHCDSRGRYSMYSSGIEDETYLRGVQVTDAKGSVTFTSVYPACYSGRWPHIHFEVYPDVASITDSSNAIATSQMAMPDAQNRLVFAESEYSGSATNYSRVSLAGDNVFGDDSGAHQLGTLSGSVAKGFTATLAVPVDTATEPSGGGAPGGSGRGPGG